MIVYHNPHHHHVDTAAPLAIQPFGGLLVVQRADAAVAAKHGSGLSEAGGTGTKAEEGGARTRFVRGG